MTTQKKLLTDDQRRLAVRLLRAVGTQAVLAAGYPVGCQSPDLGEFDVDLPMDSHARRIFDAVNKAVCEVLTATDDGWIDVEVREPAGYDPVLTAAYDTWNGEWLYRSLARSDEDWYRPHVSHWRPLPAPPPRK